MIFEESKEQLPLFRLDGRLAVITGASEGIGKSIAIAFAQSGADLALVSRDKKRLSRILDIVRGFGVNAYSYQADVRSVDDLKQLGTSINKQLGSVVILVNSAGMPFTKPALQVTEAEWDNVINTGLKGLFFTCQQFAKLMSEQGYGKIINLSSTYAKIAATGKSVYAVAKAGVSSLTRSLAVEWASSGVRINSIAPTLINTPSREKIISDEARIKLLVERIPLGRYGETKDLIGGAIFLASEASDFITGQTLFIDGGLTTAS